MLFRKNKTKQEERPSVPGPSVVEMQARVKYLSKQIDRYLEQLRTASDRYVEKAAEEKAKGRDASMFIKRIAMISQKIEQAETMKVFLETKVEDYRFMLQEKDFTAAFTEFSGLLGQYEVSTSELDKYVAVIQQATMRIDEQQTKMQTLMDKVEATLNVRMDSNDAALDDVADKIDELIDEEIKGNKDTK